MKKPVLILLLFSFLVPVFTKAQFYNRNTYRTQRNEISFGAGASSCLTDLGGGKKIEESFFKDYARAFLFDINTDQTQYVLNFSYKYFVKSKLALRYRVVPFVDPIEAKLLETIISRDYHYYAHDWPCHLKMDSGSTVSVTSSVMDFLSSGRKRSSPNATTIVVQQ